MVILSSSSKTLDFESEYSAKISPTDPVFKKQGAAIQKQLAAYSAEELEHVLDCSSKIALLNFDRMQAWKTTAARPAIFSYKGDVFKPLTPESYSVEQSEYAQQSVHIMSGLYGVVRAFDLIKPYRLEMRLSLDNFGKLNIYWRDDITTYLNQQIKKDNHPFVLNIASKEYSSAVDEQQLSIPMVHVDFKERKEDGSLRTVAIYAKQARGMMMEYCIQHTVTTLDEVKKFSAGGYSFAGEKDNHILFVR